MSKRTTLTDWAVMICSVLASEKTRMSAQNISDITGLSMTIVRKLLRMLVLSGVVVSIRGVSGGYQLSRSPDQLSVARVITAIEGYAGWIVGSAGEQSKGDPKFAQMRENWISISKQVRQFLEKKTLSDLLEDQAQQETIS